MLKATVTVAFLVSACAWAALLKPRVPVVPRPKLYGRAISPQDLDPSFNSTAKRIVLYHNFYRSRVKPTANNMLEMSWHTDAASSAQRWAEECKLLVHDNVTGLWLDDYGSCGQNIFASNVQVHWHFAIKLWFLEKQNFAFGNQGNSTAVVGHYTQMVWYSSHRVGCGFYYCSKDVVKTPFYNYVCNYCPIGNDPERFDRPYDEGQPCSACPGNCKFKKLCTNSCQYGDYWTNCGELNETSNPWTCSPKVDSCRATCRCPDAIR